MADKIDKQSVDIQQLIKQQKKKNEISVPMPEGLKKAIERENKAKLLREQALDKKLKELPQKRAEQAKRIQKYEEEYKETIKNKLINLKNAKIAGNFFKPADPKIMIVIRIRGINRLSPKSRKVLQLFRLLQIHNAVFIKVNKATVNMLKLVSPYIAYGYPDVKTIRGLLYKRGFGKVKHRPGAISRIPIMNNDFIEKHLGKYKIETIEDMVYQIYTCGEHFREVTNFLWPFKLSPPKGGYRGRKRRHFNEGGSYGNWEHHIGSMIKRML
mmetsp:Transcript_69236/g.84895  ORF Transcript_69236/g.84895 Transcript_69236/m.84895 type:complete len:270 (+) Transcript_69236:62-871(+)